MDFIFTGPRHVRGVGASARQRCRTSSRSAGVHDPTAKRLSGAAVDPATANSVVDLYDETIDFGAHPNVTALAGAFRTEDSDGSASDSIAERVNRPTKRTDSCARETAYRRRQTS